YEPLKLDGGVRPEQLGRGSTMLRERGDEGIEVLPDQHFEAIEGIICCKRRGTMGNLYCLRMRLAIAEHYAALIQAREDLTIDDEGWYHHCRQHAQSMPARPQCHQRLTRRMREGEGEQLQSQCNGIRQNHLIAPQHVAALV